MASLTIRNLDVDTKQKLRESAARNGNSMEEQARLILGALDQLSIGSGPNATSSRALPAADIEKYQNENISTTSNDNSPDILLIITGGIAAYKSLELIRRLKDRQFNVRIVMSEAATKFITPLSVEALSHNRVFTDLFNREDEQDIGHIRLAREADLIVVAPASADFIAKLANGLANDLPSTLLLAAKVPVLLAPAMNPAMWQNPATNRNVYTLKKDGLQFIGPNTGEMAEHDETGRGRMAEPGEIVDAIISNMDTGTKPLAGRHAIVTAGPTHEPIDPVRYIANRSSGKQGFAIADALARAGAKVSLVAGPVTLATPCGVNRIDVETAREMEDAVEACLPSDIAVMVAAVADWRSKNFTNQKLKKSPGDSSDQTLDMVQNPDILHGVSKHKMRPQLVVGFAAETVNLIDNAKGKLKRKGANWIIANDVSPQNEVMGGDDNTVKIITANSVEELPKADKSTIANQIVAKIVRFFEIDTAHA